MGRVAHLATATVAVGVALGADADGAPAATALGSASTDALTGEQSRNAGLPLAPATVRGQQKSAGVKSCVQST